MRCVMTLLVVLTAPWVVVFPLIGTSPAIAGADKEPCTTPSDGVPYEPRTFLGYACADDCATHKAGFAWAERHGIADAAACMLADRSSAQGCRAYVEEAVTAELAGFEWARENEIADPCRCDGAGPGFAAGCRAYLASVGD